MNSYTVNSLEPGVEYLFELCLRKEKYIIPISSTLLTTRNSGYEVALGIETDYVTLGRYCKTYLDSFLSDETTPTYIQRNMTLKYFVFSLLSFYRSCNLNFNYFGNFLLRTFLTSLVYLPSPFSSHEVKIW